MNNPWSNLVEPVIQLVKKAGEIAQQAQKKLQVEQKPDSSLVTNADRQVESFLSTELVKLLPNSSVWGEETGFNHGSKDGLWIIDPIDGTSNYIYGVPLWGISVALYWNKKIVLGVVNLPDLNEIFSSSLGGGAYLNGELLPKIKAGEIKPFELVSCPETVLSYKGIKKWPGKMRYTGAFVIEGTYVASQRFRGLIGHNPKLYDIAAIVCMIREVDGDVRYLDGSVFDESELIKDERISRPFIFFPKDSNFFIEE